MCIIAANFVICNQIFHWKASVCKVANPLEARRTKFRQIHLTTTSMLAEVACLQPLTVAPQFPLAIFFLKKTRSHSSLLATIQVSADKETVRSPAMFSILKIDKQPLTSMYNTKENFQWLVFFHKADCVKLKHYNKPCIKCLRKYLQDAHISLDYLHFKKVNIQMRGNGRESCKNVVYCPFTLAIVATQQSSMYTFSPVLTLKASLWCEHVEQRCAGAFKGGMCRRCVQILRKCRWFCHYI